MYKYSEKTPCVSLNIMRERERKKGKGLFAFYDHTQLTLSQAEVSHITYFI